MIASRSVENPGAVKEERALVDHEQLECHAQEVLDDRKCEVFVAADEEVSGKGWLKANAPAEVMALNAHAIRGMFDGGHVFAVRSQQTGHIGDAEIRLDGQA